MHACMHAWMYGYMMLVYLLITTSMIIDDMSIPIDMNQHVYRSRKKTRAPLGPRSGSWSSGHPFPLRSVATELRRIRPSQSKRKKETQNVETADSPNLASVVERPLVDGP